MDEKPHLNIIKTSLHDTIGQAKQTSMGQRPLEARMAGCRAYLGRRITHADNCLPNQDTLTITRPMRPGSQHRITPTTYTSTLTAFHTTNRTTTGPGRPTHRPPFGTRKLQFRIQSRYQYHHEPSLRFSGARILRRVRQTNRTLQRWLLSIRNGTRRRHRHTHHGTRGTRIVASIHTSH